MMNSNLLGERYIQDKKPNPFFRLSMRQEMAIFDFMEEYECGAFEIETVSCDCGSNDFDIISEKDRYGLSCQTVICRECGLVMTNPRMTQKSYNKFYDRFYRLIYTGSDQASENFFNDQYNHGTVIKKILSDFVDFKETLSILEIGCGAGGILKPFAEDGFTVKGVDLGSSYLQYGIGMGLDLENINSQELLSRNVKYDIIILSHVAEHFLDIDAELHCIYNLLSDNGKLYIEVPGINNVYTNGTYNGDLLSYFQNAHIRHFSLSTLCNTLSKSGFRLLGGDEQIVSVFTKGNSTEYSCVSGYAELLNHLINTERNFSNLKQNYNVLLAEPNRIKLEEEYSKKMDGKS